MRQKILLFTVIFTLNIFAGIGLDYSSDGPLSPNVFLNCKIFLDGPYNSGEMATTLLSQGVIPLTQPFNMPPWNYTVTESVISIPTDVVDWVLVELRTTTEASSSVSKKVGFLKKDGNLYSLDGVSALDIWGVDAGDYYVVVYHRNHLSVMSASPVSLLE